MQYIYYFEFTLIYENRLAKDINKVLIEFFSLPSSHKKVKAKSLLIL